MANQKAPASGKAPSETQYRARGHPLFGNDAPGDQALKVMEDSYEQLQQHFENVRRLSGDRDCRALDDFLRTLHFEQAPSENYFNSLSKP
ncbi:hypothetical protein [Pseudomonas sp. PB3P13]